MSISELKIYNSTIKLTELWPQSLKIKHGSTLNSVKESDKSLQWIT